MSGLVTRMASLLDEFGLLEQEEDVLLTNVAQLIEDPRIEYAQAAYDALLNVILEKGYDIDCGKVKKME